MIIMAQTLKNKRIIKAQTLIEEQVYPEQSNEQKYTQEGVTGESENEYQEE